MDRHSIIRDLALCISRVDRPHPLRVGIDGVTASGKTTLADELAKALAASFTRQIIRATVDDFHNPPGVRHVRGRMSPVGYYLDTFDYASLRALLLDPLGPNGSRCYRLGAFGQPDGSAGTFEDHTAPNDAILIVEGVFLFRPALNHYWDYRVFIEVDQHHAMERGIARDAARMGGTEAAQQRYEARYVPGERIYLDAVKPQQLADAVVTNDVFKAPTIHFQ